MITDEQKISRKYFIGGSDAAAACGINPWISPLQLYLEKTGQIEPYGGNDATYWGNVLEPVVASRLAEVTGMKVRRYGATIRSKTNTFMGAHLDYKVTAAPIVVEIKTTGYFGREEWGPSGTDQIPVTVMAQVQHQMVCINWKKAIIGVLIGGQDFRYYFVDYDPNLAKLIIEKERAFWQSVKNRIPPEPTTLCDVDCLYPLDNGKTITATPEILQIIEALKTEKNKEKIVARNVDDLELKLKKFLAENTTLQDDRGRTLATWKTQRSTRLDLKALRKDHSDIADLYLTTLSSRIMRISK